MINFGRDNERVRNRWLAGCLSAIPAGQRILDAGAGELKNKAYCTHLKYVSQDLCEYEGQGDGAGLQTGRWDTERIDIVSDICNVPEPDRSFDAILCSEVFEHLPDPQAALNEFSRLLRKDGLLILTAPFCSLTHFAPFHYCTGFSRYWFQHHLGKAGFEVTELVPNGNWFSYVAQELFRLPSMGRSYSSVVLGWLALAAAVPVLVLMRLMSTRGGAESDELLCFGWHVVARRAG